MYDENAWQEFRAEALEFAKNRAETNLKSWLNRIGYTDVVGYYLDYSNHTMEIYATRIGRLVGRAGVYVAEFEKMLCNEYQGEWKVKFTEIRGGFINA